MPFDAKLRRGAGKIQLQMTREGNAWGIPLKLTKAITMEEGDPRLFVAYMVEGAPRDRQIHLARWSGISLACLREPTIASSTAAAASVSVNWALA